MEVTHRTLMNPDEIVQSTSRRQTLRIVGLILCTYPLNISVVSILRITDVVILVVFAWFALSNRLKRTPGRTILWVIVPLVFSSAMGLAMTGFSRFSIAGAAFVFKYFQICMLVWILCSLEMSDADRRRLLRLAATVYWMMVAYVFGRLIVAALGIVSLGQLGGPRPDFPFTPQGEIVVNAGHLFGAYLVTGMMMWLAYLLWRRPGVIGGTITAMLSAGALLMSGSRGPILAALIAVLAVSVVRFGRFKAGTYTVRIMAIGGLAVAVGFTLLLSVSSSGIGRIGDAIGMLVERSFRFSLDAVVDRSLLARIEKTLIGVHNLVRTGGFVGAGPFLYPSFFDNGVIRLVHDVGVLGSIIIGYVIGGLLKMSLRRRPVFGWIPFVGLMTYIAANITAEFYMVTRSVVPVIVVLWLLLQATIEEKRNAYAPGSDE